MNAHPHVRRHFHQLRDLLSREEAAIRWTIIAIILVLPAALILNTLNIPIFLAAIPGFAAIVLYAYYANRVNNEAVISCPKCSDKGEVSDNPIITTWVCGFCAKTNTVSSLPWRKTLCGPCQNPRCKRHPHSLICWRCREPIIWDEGDFRRDPERSAWLPDYPPVIATQAPAIDRPPEILDEHLR